MCQSRQTEKLEEPGLKSTDIVGSGMDALREVYYSGGFKTQSNYARANAPAVAFLASLSLITSIDQNRQPSNVWRITAKGLGILETLGYD